MWLLITNHWQPDVHFCLVPLLPHFISFVCYFTPVRDIHSFTAKAKAMLQITKPSVHLPLMLSSLLYSFIVFLFPPFLPPLNNPIFIYMTRLYYFLLHLIKHNVSFFIPFYRSPVLFALSY